jgi:hypothetical protein
MQQIDSISNKLYTKVDIAEPYRIDAKPYVERPFYVGSVVFSSSTQRGQVLYSSIRRLPGDIIRSNPSLLNAMKIGSLYRSDLVLNISMAGTITHGGCVLVAILPPLAYYPYQTNGSRLINTMLTSPHAFLYANEATSVNLQVPWYCNSDMATLDMELQSDNYKPSIDIVGNNGNYGTLVFVVLNPLAPSTGSSSSVNIVIEACFKRLDVVVPTPRYVSWVAQSGVASAVTGLFDMATNGLKRVTGDAIDGGRFLLKEWTGLHNPNTPRITNRIIQTQRNFPNVVDNEQFFEKLDPYSDFNRVVKEPIFGSDVDEMSIDHIVSKKQYLGKFTVSQTDPVGKLLWARPISPFQGGGSYDDSHLICSNNLELMHTLHRAWRGDLNLHLVSSQMNNKQQVKLKVIKMYNPSKSALTSVPLYSTVVNAPSHLLEYTQGGQEHCVSLPFLSRNDLIPCAEDPNFEGMFHGLYYIYLAQPLVNSDGSPMSVEFNVYMSGSPSLTFYGYAFRTTDSYPLISIPANLTASEPSVEDRRIFEPQSGVIRVMNEPQRQADEVDRDDKLSSVSHFTRLRPNLDMRPLIRRMYRAATSARAVALAGDNNCTRLPLSTFVSEAPPSLLGSGVALVNTPTNLISSMYYGKSVGFKIKVQFLTKSSELDKLSTRVYYIPPNFMVDTSGVVLGCLTNTSSVSSVNPTFSGLYKEPPVTFQIDPANITTTSLGFEFTIPDVTYYKFMGSSYKFNYPLDVSLNDSIRSTSDFGVVLIYSNCVDASGGADNVLVYESIFVGLDDTSRMGFHTMAPLFGISKVGSIYLGYNGDPEASIPGNCLNSYLYRGDLNWLGSFN